MKEGALTCHTALTVWVASNWKKPAFFPGFTSLSYTSAILNTVKMRENGNLKESTPQLLTVTEPSADLYVPHKRNLNSTLGELNT